MKEQSLGGFQLLGFSQTEQSHPKRKFMCHFSHHRCSIFPATLADAALSSLSCFVWGTSVRFNCRAQTCRLHKLLDHQVKYVVKLPEMPADLFNAGSHRRTNMKQYEPI